MAAGKKVLAPKRIYIIYLLMALALFVLALRLFWVQIVWGGDLRQQAEEFRTQNIILNPNRGNIYDRNRNELVSSIPAFSVYVQPRELKEPQALADKLAPLLSMKTDAVYQKVSSGKTFVWIIHGIDLETADRIKKLNLEGVGLVEGSKRAYKQGSMAAHLLGFVGDDNQGLAGIEKRYDEQLGGTPGWLITENDAAGKPIPQAAKRVYSSRPGSSLVLTVDQTIQYFVERELNQIETDYQPSEATIIVMDPKTGEVLAMGSRPTFEPGNWSAVSDKIWNGNTATLYNYEPGSTFKMFIGAAGLEEKSVKETDSFYDPGFSIINGRKVFCWVREGHGYETFIDAVQNSCNTVFIQVGMKLGKERLYKYLKGFGFGAPTGIDLPGEEAGVIRPEEKSIDLDLATMCIGQSIAVTPIQLITAVSAIANGGNLMKPHLVKEILDDKGNIISEIKSQTIRQPISGDTARRLSSMLEKVVLEGTGKMAQVEGYRIAGKTGTAQVPGPGGYLEGKYVASFAGFAPSDDPRIAVLVVVAEPKGGKYHGGEVAAPAFQTIMRDTLVYLGIPEQKDQYEEGSLSTGSTAKDAVSSGLIPVPEVVGFPVTEAVNILKESGMTARPSASQGIVSEQNPAGNSSALRGSLVSLKVTPFNPSKPPDNLIVPNLTGLTVKKTGILLESLGLKLEGQGNGLAQEQQPLPGTQVKPGSTIKVLFKIPD